MERRSLDLISTICAEFIRENMEVARRIDENGNDNDSLLELASMALDVIEENDLNPSDQEAFGYAISIIFSESQRIKLIDYTYTVSDPDPAYLNWVAGISKGVLPKKRKEINTNYHLN